MKNLWTQYLDAALLDRTKTEHHELQHPSSVRYQVRRVFAAIRVSRQILWDQSVGRSPRSAEHLACFGPSAMLLPAYKRFAAVLSISGESPGRERMWYACRSNWTNGQKQIDQKQIDMASREAKSDVLEFLDSYGRAFEAFDTEAILTHFLFPCHIVSDADNVALMPLANASETRVGVERVLALHRELGVRSGRRLDLDVIEMSPRMVGLVLRHEFIDAAGRALYDFQGIYTLVKADGRYRIAAISHNQIPRLVGCVASRRPPA